MITITLNGTTKKINENTTATILLADLDIESKRLAIEVNENILSRGQFDSYFFKDSDTIEIVHAIGGG